MATSSDLETWTKRGAEPIVASDPRWYVQGVDPLGPDEAWRDPWVFRDPAGDGWHMLITARANSGPSDQRGVIGHARSHDLVTWEVMPPLSEPGTGFSHLEVPQVEHVDGRWLLVFSCFTPELNEERRVSGETGGVWALEAPGPLGPFDPRQAIRLTDESLYAGRIVRRRDGSSALLAFVNRAPDGAFGGSLCDPIPLQKALDRAHTGGFWTSTG
jgi:beta-fructofuranosidase